MSEYDDILMDIDFLEPDIGLPIQVCVDFGVTTAAIFGQKTKKGTWNILHELVTLDMRYERFGELLESELATKCPQVEVLVHGDAAVVKRD